jgi:hypothetical protein
MKGTPMKAKKKLKKVLKTVKKYCKWCAAVYGSCCFDNDCYLHPLYFGKVEKKTNKPLTTKGTNDE